MDYRKTAQQICDNIGGRKNIISAAHCATRLRLVIGDNDKCSKEAIEAIDGVKGVFFASGQLQIIFGTGTVNKVYDEFIQIAGISASSREEVRQPTGSKYKDELLEACSKDTGRCIYSDHSGDRSERSAGGDSGRTL